MSRFPNLPGFIINAVDGGLAARRAPIAKSTLIFGTAAQGVADSPYQVTDRAVAAKEFGFQGSLIRAMEEVAAQGSDNIILFRMGSKPATLKGVGKDTTVGSVTPGFDIESESDH